MIAGAESEDELSRRLVASHTNLREVKRELSKKIDEMYYSATVDEDRGIARTFRRSTQSNDMMPRYISDRVKR